MKKLVTSAMALMAGLALATGVESANIVGYFDKNLPSGESTWACSTFTPIGGAINSFTLADIVPNANFAAFEDTIQFATAAGEWEDQLTYVSAAWLKGNDLDESLAGWYVLEDEELSENLNDTVLPYAKGFCAISSYEGAALRFAGEVPQTDTAVALGQGESTWMGNASVNAITLADLVPNANFAAFEDTIQFATAAGEWEDQLTYVSAAWLKGNDLDESLAGWYVLEDEELSENLNDTVVPAGKAFCAISSYSGAAITIPSPLN